MQRLEVSGAVRPIYGSLGVKRDCDVCEPCCSFCVSPLLFYLKLYDPNMEKDRNGSLSDW